MTTELKVKTLQGKLWSINVEQTDTIAIVKKKLDEKEAGPAEAQRLIFGGKILEDAKTVAEYELTKGENPAPLFLVVNPEMAKKAEDARKAAKEAEAKKAAAEAARLAAMPKPEDIAKQIEGVSKKIGATKSIDELVATLEKEIAALKGKPAPGAGSAAAKAAPAVEWACGTCTSINKPGARKCEVCDTPNPNAPKGAAGGSDPWTCTGCTYNNKAGTRRCGMCDSANPAFPAPAAAHAQRRRSISPNRAGGGDDFGGN